jgi:hypothetical protein
MQIRVYDPFTLELLTIITKSTSIQWTRRFYDVGSFEMHFDRKLKQAAYLRVGNIISHNGNFGIIRYNSFDEARADNDVKICGHTLQGLLSRQVVPPFVYMTGTIDPLYSYDRISGNGETVMKHYVDKHIVHPTDADRKIQHFVIAANTGRGLESVAWQAKFTNLPDELYKLGRYVGLGWEVTLGDFEDGITGEKYKQYVFDVIQGVDRTRNQSDVAPVMFCRQFKNIKSGSYTNDQMSSFNVAYIGSDGEEEQQKVYKSGSAAGILRREGYIAASGDTYEEVRDVGDAYLKENAPKESVEAAANDKLTYKTDWDLGDYVTVKIEVLGETVYLDKQITEVREVYERGNRDVEPVFGEKKESVIKKMKRSW